MHMHMLHMGMHMCMHMSTCHVNVHVHVHGHAHGHVLVGLQPRVMGLREARDF